MTIFQQDVFLSSLDRIFCCRWMFGFHNVHSLPANLLPILLFEQKTTHTQSRLLHYLSKRWSPKSGANEVTRRPRISRTPVQAQACQQSASRGASAQPLDRQNMTLLSSAIEQFAAAVRTSPSSRAVAVRTPGFFTGLAASCCSPLPELDLTKRRSRDCKQPFPVSAASGRSQEQAS